MKGWRGLVAGILGLVSVASCRSPTAPSDPGELDWSSAVQDAGYRRFDAAYQSADGTRLVGSLCLPPGTGPFPAIVFHFGSDRWTRLGCASTVGWLVIGMATFTYDKRGVGESGGSCCPFDQPDYFPLLAGDVLASARSVAGRSEIDPARVGAYGFSQGGWVVPVAASLDSDTIRWTIVGSGPTTTLGEELRYSDLTGDSRCTPSGRSAEAIEALMNASPKSGFDPLPYLEQLLRPSLWIYGALDTSIPVDRSVRILADLVARRGIPTIVHVIPNINHSWVVGGAMCQLTGQRWDDSTVIVPWLRTHGII